MKDAGFGFSERLRENENKNKFLKYLTLFCVFFRMRSKVEKVIELQDFVSDFAVFCRLGV